MGLSPKTRRNYIHTHTYTHTYTNPAFLLLSSYSKRVLLAGKKHIDPEMSSAGAESPKAPSSSYAGAAAASAVAAPSDTATKKSTTAYAASSSGGDTYGTDYTVSFGGDTHVSETTTASASMDEPTAKAPVEEPIGDTGGDAAPAIPSAGKSTYVDDIDDAVSDDDDAGDFFG